MGNGHKNKLVSAVVAAFLLAVPLSAQAKCLRDVATLIGPFGTTEFAVELAITPETTAQGLMHREVLAPDSGMLFFFDPPRRVAFWMRNTLIPLDMIFVDARGVVRKVHANAIPHDETSIPSDGPIAAVLEINGGLAAKIGISKGALIQHPLLNQARSAFPCPIE